MDYILNLLWIISWAIGGLGTLILLIKTHGRIANDPWNSKETSFEFVKKVPILEFDKIQHFAGGFVMGLFFGVWAVGLGWFWEFKDAIIPYEKLSGRWKLWGGDGFSWKDGIMTTVGVILGALIQITIREMYAL